MRRAFAAVVIIGAAVLSAATLSSIGDDDWCGLQLTDESQSAAQESSWWPPGETCTIDDAHGHVVATTHSGSVPQFLLLLAVYGLIAAWVLRRLSVRRAAAGAGLGFGVALLWSLLWLFGAVA